LRPGATGVTARRPAGGSPGKKAGVPARAPRPGGEAAPAAGDRGADRDRVGIVAAGDLEAGEPLRPRLDRDHLADIGDDAGEHALLTPLEPFDRVRPYGFAAPRCQPRRARLSGKREPVEGGPGPPPH